MAYYDPIAFGFSFKAVTDGKVVPELKSAFRDLLAPLRDCIMEYGGYGGPAPVAKTPSAVTLMFQTENNIPMETPSRTLLPDYGDSAEKAEQYWSETMEALDDERCQGLEIYISDTMSRRRYAKGATRAGKRYAALLTDPIRIEALKANREQLCEILSCPSDDLAEVRVPASGFYGVWLFNVSYKQMPIQRKESLMVGAFRVIADIPEEWDEPCLHNISICIPRFLIHQDFDLPALQNLWTDILCRLGNLFPCSVGTVDMDASHPNTTTAFDEAERFNGNIWLSDAVPGYAWGMLINSTQQKRLGAFPHENGPDGFYRIRHLNHGNVYFQKTEDWRVMSRQDCHFLREFFRQSLTPGGIGHEIMKTFPAFRLGFDADELEFGNTPPCCNFVVNHSAFPKSD